MDYRESIYSDVIDVHQIADRQSVQPFVWLSNSIRNGKVNLKINTVDFIIIKILDRNHNVYKFKTKQSFDVYVIGSFRKFFNPTLKVAEAFADFYLEMGILPNIISIPKHIYIKNIKHFHSKLRNGVLIYERR